jgi:hypothetical protein
MKTWTADQNGYPPNGGGGGLGCKFSDVSTILCFLNAFEISSLVEICAIFKSLLTESTSCVRHATYKPHS